MAFLFLTTWAAVMSLAQAFSHDGGGAGLGAASPPSFKFGVRTLFDTDVLPADGRSRHVVFGLLAFAAVATVAWQAAVNVLAGYGLTLRRDPGQSPEEAKAKAKEVWSRTALGVAAFFGLGLAYLFLARRGGATAYVNNNNMPFPPDNNNMPYPPDYYFPR